MPRTGGGDDNQEIYDNLIFMMPPAVFSDVFDEIGEPKEGLEKIKDYKETIFWSFHRKEYQKRIGGLRRQVQRSATS